MVSFVSWNYELNTPYLKKYKESHLHITTTNLCILAVVILVLTVGIGFSWKKLKSIKGGKNLQLNSNDTIFYKKIGTTEIKPNLNDTDNPTVSFAERLYPQLVDREVSSFYDHSDLLSLFYFCILDLFW